METQTPPSSTRPPSIVGIGASAGGLAALEQFLGKVPPDSGLAYVVVQHLDPTQKALLPQLLQRVTAMPVREAEHGTPVRPDCVYVIPPDTQLTVANGTLQLARPSEPRGLRLPIDVLFSSLAGDQGERAIGVVLSGMGSDGTLGALAIKAVGGLTVAQEPGSAQFESMPRSAMAADCADIIGPPAALPARIQAYAARMRDPASSSQDNGAQALEKIVRLLQQRTGHDFSLYKSSTLQRRIERRMGIHELSSLVHYADFLEHNTQETDLLFSELLIGVTAFFRDPMVWEYLAETALPALLARRAHEPELRAWVIGCSTGEEAYSLAMVFSEVVARLPQPHGFTLEIFASDLSADAIATARRGIYPLSIRDQIGQERLDRFFIEHETHYRIKPEIRDMVLFAQHDVALAPPFTRLDLIACRNLLIYLGPELQRKLVPLFHYCLRPGGLLLLGGAETVGAFGSLFTPVEFRLRLYQRRDAALQNGAHFLLNSFPPLSGRTKEARVSPSDPRSPLPSNLQTAADQLLLQVYAPAAVLLNEAGDIVYISGHTGKYLEPAAGKATWNIFAMAREGLRGALVGALERASASQQPQHLHRVEVTSPGGPCRVAVTVDPLQEPGPLQGMTMIVFRDAPLPPPGDGDIQDADGDARTAELQQCHDEIHRLRNEARSSREDLQSANEELQSTNEELRSANEELMTSKEEMQSMNEELQTINAELQTKLDDLALAQSDMQNLLNSVEIAILFLDQNLNVRRYTERAATLIHLRERDLGRPLSDLNTTLDYPGLHDDARETLRTLAFSQKQVRADDGRWFSVRIMPYRRLDNVIDGVVITLLDITGPNSPKP
ncbi:two-component system CheB/CheR fusion protein [Thioalkalivibrio sp. ALE21]|uniref:chemotaxis protein CheB n=1 Tax=Thioalkalivibrio sp. ALE21 TaxID=1158175 RepID=UPI000D96CB75|nr:chemotaxis protein CheB [Thioalkalivibrio sp. ALE21]PYF99707.1 two-component system CheB/CheR fusion protein [Thioalkalivibrio sp. ALE21]